MQPLTLVNPLEVLHRLSLFQLLLLFLLLDYLSSVLVDTLHPPLTLALALAPVLIGEAAGEPIEF